METSPATPMRSRVLSASDWIDAAMAALIADGIGAVQIDALARRLGATKGSFYHHFPNRDALISATLAEWERRDTEAVKARLELIADPRVRIHAVMTAAINDRAGGLRDAALLESSAHPLIRPVVERATQTRIRYLTNTYIELGLTRAEASRRAIMTSAAYIGLYAYMRNAGLDVTDRLLRAYAEDVLAALVPAGPREEDT